MRRLTLILGGARSGKSTHAEKLAAERGGPVLFVATAEALDPEMAARIARHRAERPAAWRTLEAPRAVGAAIASEGDAAQVIIVDCLTVLAGNVLGSLGASATALEAEAALDRELDELIDAWRTSSAEWIVVSNEVGQGVVPAYPLGRAYRDALGKANQRLAALADQVVILIAGLPWRLKG